MRRLTKRRRWPIVLGAAATLVAVLGYQWQAAIERNRSVPDEPFRIAGNLYYVGATGVTAFLLTGPEGHVLIDGGYPETAALIIASVAKLGFDIKDVRVLLNSHAHFDHAGGLKALQEASGAQLWISEGDAPLVAAGGAGDRATYGPLRFVGLGRFPAPRVDRRFTDGTTVRVGPLALTAHVTAGHTPGCTSWPFPVRHGDRELLAVDVCSLTLLPFMTLVEPEAGPGGHRPAPPARLGGGRRRRQRRGSECQALSAHGARTHAGGRPRTSRRCPWTRSFGPTPSCGGSGETPTSCCWSSPARRPSSRSTARRTGCS